MVKGWGAALSAWMSFAAFANPLGVNTYEQTFKVKFADAEAAKRAECVMSRLPDGASAMLSARWDDSNPRHVAKVQMLKEVGVKSTIYANGTGEFLDDEAKKIMDLGNSIGNHTTSHPFLMEISANRDFSEILLNRIAIETALDASCVSFAAPYGWCAAIDEEKPVLVSDILFNTGHYVSGDNVIPETKGGENKRYPTRLVRSGDSKVVPEQVAKSFTNALEWIAANPRFPRMSYGIHSWCDSAGNRLQAQTIRDAWRDDWCTGTDAEYGAYSYQFDYGKIEKAAVNGDVAEFKVTRFDPRPLGSAIPMSVRFSETPKEIPLSAGLRGTYALPHDAIHKIVTKIGKPLSEKFPKINVELKLDADLLHVKIRNDSEVRMDDIYGVVMLPPKWKNGRVVFKFPPLAPGEDLNLGPIILEPSDRKDYAYGTADYACSVDFNQNGEACRIWAQTKERGEDPAEQPMPAKKVKWIGPFDVSKLNPDSCKAMSVPDVELKDVGEAVNEKWSSVDPEKVGLGFTVHFWPDFNNHPEDNLAYRDAVAPLIAGKRQARLFAWEFIANCDGPARLYASTDRGLPSVTPCAWLNGESVRLERKVVNEINVKKGVNRIVVRLDMVQSRWPESASLVVCPNGLDAPFPVRDMVPNFDDMFAWRGFMLDEGRHFFGKQAVKDILDHMADYRLNRFHWHLTEDQGWRLEIPGMPELVQYGAKRPSSPLPGDDTGSDGKEYGPFFYTVDDVKEIVEYADKRGIVVIPEIEIPGHTRALLAAHPEFACEGVKIDRVPWCQFGICEEVICAGNDEVLRYYERIFDEVMKMFPGPYIHIGGDECPKDQWKKCPKCQARIKAEGLKDEEALQGWITRHMVEYISGNGRRAIGWDEIMDGGELPKGTIIQSWRGAEGGIAAAKNGYDVIMSPLKYTYFSIPQYIDGYPYAIRKYVRDNKMVLPDDKVRSYNPLAGIPAESSKHVLGAECCAWSEVICGVDELKFKCFDRIGAFSEAVNKRKRGAVK